MVQGTSRRCHRGLIPPAFDTERSVPPFGARRITALTQTRPLQPITAPTIGRSHPYRALRRALSCSPSWVPHGPCPPRARNSGYEPDTAVRNGYIGQRHIHITPAHSTSSQVTTPLTKSARRNFQADDASLIFVVRSNEKVCRRSALHRVSRCMPRDLTPPSPSARRDHQLTGDLSHPPNALILDSEHATNRIRIRRPECSIPHAGRCETQSQLPPFSIASTRDPSLGQPMRSLGLPTRTEANCLCTKCPQFGALPEIVTTRL